MEQNITNSKQMCSSIRTKRTLFLKTLRSVNNCFGNSVNTCSKMLKSLFPWKHNKTKQVMAAQPPMDEELILQEANLLPCHVCGRTFLPNPLKKHEKVCEKNAIKKRKPFDSLKQRVAGTDLADFHQPTYVKKKEDPVVEKNPRHSKWKEKHLEFVTAIRAAKGVPADRMSPTPKVRSTTSLTASTAANERCPSCDRHFGPKAFDRHVEWCKEKKARIQQSPASVQQAKERLEARIKYRVPPLNKSKRSLIREKYSTNSNPHSPEPVCNKNAISTTNLLGSLSRGPSIRKPKSLVSVDKPNGKVIRSDVERCGGDKKRNSSEEDRKMSLSFGLPVIGSPSPKAESVKSLQSKRNPITCKKLNTTSINNQVEGMVVSSISQSEVNRRMVTWKDTVKKSNRTVEKNSSLGKPNVINSTEYSKLHLEQGAGKALAKQTTGNFTRNPTRQARVNVGRVEISIPTASKDTIKLQKFNPTNPNSKVDAEKLETETLPVASKSTKNPQTFSKEKTFYLEKTVPNKAEPKTPILKRNIDSHLDLSTETKSEMLSTQNVSKTAMEKILSSNDVFHKIQMTKIPTKRNIKNIPDFLKTLKKKVNKNACTTLKKSEKFKTEHTLAQNDNSEGRNEDVEDLEEYSKEKAVPTIYNKDAGEEMPILNLNLDEITGNVSYFGNTNKKSFNFDENLNEVKKLNYPFQDDADLLKCDKETDNIKMADDNININKWFEDNFIEESVNENSEFSRKESVVLNEELGNNKDENELDGTSEKDSLEDVPLKSKSFNDENLRPLTYKNTDENLLFKNKLEVLPKINSIDLTPKKSHYKSTNVIVEYLFQSGTNLDLTRDNSQNTLTDKKSWSSFSTVNLEKVELNQISKETLPKEAESSNFNLRKSFSDINLWNNKSLSNFGEREDLKKDVIPLFVKRQFVFESESVDFRKTCQDIRIISSVPVVHLSSFQLKKDQKSVEEPCVKVEEAGKRDDVTILFSHFKFSQGQSGHKEIVGEKNKVDWTDVGSKERLEILRIAAEKFIEEMKKNKSKCVIPFGNVLEEDYSVPKKKRRVCLSEDNDTNFGQNSEDSGVFNWQDNRTNGLCKSEDEELKLCADDLTQNHVKKVCEDSGIKSSAKVKDSVRNSATSSVISEITPRTVNLIEKIVQGKKLRGEHSYVLLALSVSECEKLFEIDKDCLRKVEKKVEKRLTRERIKLPLIVGDKKMDGQKDQMVQVEFVERKKSLIKLPKIGGDKRQSCEESQATKCQGDKKRLEIQSNASNYDPFEVAQRQFMELLECDDFKPFTPSDPPLNNPPSRPHTTVPTPLKTPSSPIPAKKNVKSADSAIKNGKKRESVIDPPVKFKDSLDSVTTDNDDFELIENMINERFGDEKKDETNGNTNNGFYLHNLTQNKDSLSLDKILANRRKYSDDMSSSIDPRLINENDNLSIPEHFKIDDYSPTSTVDTDITLQNDDVDQYSVQYDAKIESIEPKIERKPLIKRSLSLISRNKRDASHTNSKNTKVFSNNNSTKKGTVSGKTASSPVSKPASKSHISGSSYSSSQNGGGGKARKAEKKNSLPLLKRSMTLFDPSPKPSFKNKQEVNDYFNGNEVKTTTTTISSSMTASVTTTSVENSATAKTDSPPLEDTTLIKVEELFAVDDEMYEEYKKYEEMYLREKEQNSNSNKKNKNKNMDLNYGLLTASEEEDHSNNSNNKLSNDSAYGSLRKTSKHRSRAPTLSPLDPKHVESTSSSGSENGPSSPAAAPPSSNSPKVSKFCHECGTKFPVTAAKFCVECGVKRLVL